jgi:hypothetical protein
MERETRWFLIGDASEGKSAQIVQIDLADPGVIVEWVRECLFERCLAVDRTKWNTRLPWQELPVGYWVGFLTWCVGVEEAVYDPVQRFLS